METKSVVEKEFVIKNDYNGEIICSGTTIVEAIENAPKTGGFANLFFANLSNRDLHNVDFSNTILQDASFEGSCLCGANFKNAYLIGVDFRNADLCGADLSFADSARFAFFRKTIIDENTKFPSRYLYLFDKSDQRFILRTTKRA